MFTKKTVPPLFRRNRLSIFAFIVGLIFTLWSWQYSVYLENAKTDQRFRAVANDYQQALSKRFDTYLRALIDLRGLFAANEVVSKDEFIVFMKSIELVRDFPGIRRLGYAPLVNAADIGIFQAQAQKDVLPGYHLKSPQRNSYYFPNLYAYPATPQIQARILGIDLGQLPNRREVMDLARDTNRPALTGKVFMPSIPEGPSSIGIYLPVYHKKLPLNTVSERRKALSGFVYEGFTV